MAAISTTPVQTAAQPARLRRSARRLPSRRAFCLALMLTVVASIVILGFELGPDASARPVADPALDRLLSGMALIKGLLALIASGAVAWRFQYPAGNVLVGTYLTGVWLMVAGAVALWHGIHLAWAAPLFHLGEFTVLLCAWRDGRTGWWRRST